MIIILIKYCTKVIISVVSLTFDIPHSFSLYLHCLYFMFSFHLNKYIFIDFFPFFSEQWKLSKTLTGPKKKSVSCFRFIQVVFFIKLRFKMKEPHSAFGRFLFYIPVFVFDMFHCTNCKSI